MKAIINSQKPCHPVEVEPEVKECIVYLRDDAWVPPMFNETTRTVKVLVLPNNVRGAELAPLPEEEEGWSRRLFYDNTRAGTSQLAQWYKPLAKLDENEEIFL